MKKILLWIHQLPQNLIGFLMTRKYQNKLTFKWLSDEITVYYTKNVFGAGVCLGDYVLLDADKHYQDEVLDSLSIRHELGHHHQSLYSGWLYLLIVGLPSALRNIWDRIFHKRWSVKDRLSWYYSSFPEKQAEAYTSIIRSYK